MELFDSQPIIGMVHLDPLPGAPQFDGDRAAIRRRALDDARALDAGGVDGVIVENFGDAPFYPEDVPTHVVAAMTSLVGAVADTVDVPVGVNVLRNDAEAALSIAAATEASFVRINVHTGARRTDQGIVEGRAHDTLRLREQLDVDVRILADVAVKHSEPLGPENVQNETRDAVERGLADAVVVSGAGTGHDVPRDRLDAVADAAHECTVPVYVGSGVTHDTAVELLSVADGAIVGSALKADGNVHEPVDRSRVEALIDAID
ncbi:BtpA/SgcQ family protein [Halocatena salina]|uniref:BtpA/SgcQ family protein n=1 Tax=Halocatena salina TaxID=2934340 RepID=A0A8U0A7A7_9EURY|nr:BtpA/SgcQ family protein [Halocatena salina]UPM43797.1 BtpA/SgcQ family protein [Halocatena salina]